MIHVIRSIERVPEKIVSRYKSFSAATVHEAYDGRGALSSRIKPISPDMKVCGPAVTVKLRPYDNLMLHKAIYVAEKGDVLVADGDGFTEVGAWGEMMALAARQRGIRGLVFNGAIRDSQAMIELGFPVFCCGLCIKGTEKKSLGLINHPLVLDNIAINPGDLILGDRDGLVVVRREDAGEVLQKALARGEREKGIAKRLKKGESTLDIFGFTKILEVAGLKEETNSNLRRNADSRPKRGEAQNLRNRRGRR